MQNFSNSPAPHTLPGFSGRGGGGPPYPPQPADPHISPRMADDFAGMQQSSLPRSHHHPSQTSHMLAYSARNRAAVDPQMPQGNMHSGNSSNPYRKDSMDFYFSMGGKDRHRRGAIGYGAGLGYPGIDGHLTQYRHAGSGSGPPSGMMSPYPVEYGSSAGSGAASGAFSPSHQYSLNPAMQAVAGSQIQPRQLGQTFLSAHHGQHHKNYPQSGHRMTPHYPQYSPQGGTSTGSSGMYSPPPQRYVDGGFDPKVNSSPSVNPSANSVPGPTAANTMGPVEGAQQSYHVSNYPGFPPQTASVSKQAAAQQRNSLHNSVVGYDNANKMQHQGPSPGTVYAKHHQASNHSIPQAVSHEMTKSPMHPNAQQMNQNFSPISNPSPAASAVHSPSCSSSPSPLMGVADAHGVSSAHAPSHPLASNRSSHGHGRPLQTMPQLSPTPNSNSSVSSCGSSSSHRLQNIGGANNPLTCRSKVGLVSREEGCSVYSTPMDKMPDAGLNSLSALSSQVANLPNTVQHMALTDTVLSQKRGKDGGHVQQVAHGLPHSQPRSRNASAASSTSTVKEAGNLGVGDGAGFDTGVDEDSLSVGGLTGAKAEREDHFEGESVRVRQVSGTSSGSEPVHPASRQTHQQTGLELKVKTCDSPSGDSKAHEVNIPPVPSSFGSDSLSSSPASNAAGVPPRLNNVPEPERVSNHHQGADKKTSVEKEAIKSENEDVKKEKSTCQVQQRKETQRKENCSRDDEKEEKHTPDDPHSASGVGVIVSARGEGSRNDKSNNVQEISSLEKHAQAYSTRDSSSHNGDEGMDLSLYSSHHQAQQKAFFGRLQNSPQSGSNKYGYPESTYGSNLSMKNRGREDSGAAMESNSKYYQQSHTGYAAMHPKDIGSVAEALAKRAQGAGARSHEENSQMQQFPSLLQEVLQGYNLDKRYGRPEQAFPAHAQQLFQTRHSYGMNESMRLHSGVLEAPGQTSSPGKPPHTNQRHRSDPAFTTDLQSSAKSEQSDTKCFQKAEKVGVSQSHLPQTAEAQQPPPKHINLADYSLPQRKASSTIPTQSSAVQELLLQEPEPLAGSIGDAEPQKSSGCSLAPSERRSVICDVSPNRHNTPEKESEREREKSQSGATVIQTPFSTKSEANDLSKKERVEKQIGKTETTPKQLDTGLNAEREGGAAAESDPEFHSKPSHSSVVMSAEHYRPSHSHGANPLSSPPRHQSYLHGVDLSSSNASSFPAYRYGDARDASVLPRSGSHFPSHQYHMSSPLQSANKLQMYPHARGPPHPPLNMNDWVKAMNRPSKEMMLLPGSPPGRHKISPLDQRQRLISPPDAVGDLHGNKLLQPQSSYFDMKMWESTHAGREGPRMMEGEPYFRAQVPAPSAVPVASHNAALSQKIPVPHSAEPDLSRGAAEETKPPSALPAAGSIKSPPEMNSTQPPVPRLSKTGSSGDTNPLMLRRRVRSFISPIPAKRQLQDPSLQRPATNSHQSPGAHPESRNNDEDYAHSELPRLSSPLPRDSFSQPLSPSGGTSKAAPHRKGRGLKLEAIVQKITPNVKKPGGPLDDGHYLSFSHSEPFSDSQDQDFSKLARASGGDDAYMDESNSLNDLIPFRGVDEGGPLPLSAFPCDPKATQPKKQDFDFGLGAAVESVTGDKDDFTLLGPLPPPPPLPRPVQCSPPPSSSALSDIQNFTNTYQQLETRRGEQSAANLLRQKLQEPGMGFNDYPGSDYFGTAPAHQAQGHMLNRQMLSARSGLSPQDCKPPESSVPKGYFPSGKKKGRPVGSVNKQKKAQNQAQIPAQTPSQNTTVNAPPAPPTPTAAPTQSQAAEEPADLTEASAAPPLPDETGELQLAPPVLTQEVKMDAESEDTQPETDAKPPRQRRRGLKNDKEQAEGRGRQRMRRRGGVAVTQLMTKNDLDAPVGPRGTLGTNRAFPDPARKGPFIPHIHVENKVPEIGAVCTIVNAQEDKMKGERSAVAGKPSGSGIDSLLTSAFSSQSSRREREVETEEVETSLQSGKAVPSSGYIVPGPVLTETNHSGRLLCCLCQKWANYKHLGDLYGPFYPAEYAAKLPKNPPQVRQSHSAAITSKAGPHPDMTPLNTVPEMPTDGQFSRLLAGNDFPGSLVPASLAFPAPVRHAPTAFKEEPMLGTGLSSALGTTFWDMQSDNRPAPELKREPDTEFDQHPSYPQQSSEEAQRPQHRKLTSHPRFKRRQKSSEKSPRMVPSNSKASLPFQPPPPALDSLGPLAQLAQLPQMPMDPEELWVHESCIVWTSGVYLVSGRLYGLQEALDGARETSCSYCEMVGSTLGCYSKGCTLRYHYLCAIEADCSLNEDNFSLRCPKHKVKRERTDPLPSLFGFPRASGPPSPSTWSSRREAEDGTPSRYRQFRLTLPPSRSSPSHSSMVLDAFDEGR
ncbi:transcription factor 20 [Neosynchiropus ocellatus]